MTIETQESVVLRGSSDRRSSLKWCPACRRQVEMVTPEQAARIVHVSEHAVCACIEAGRVHFTETAEGLLLICLKKKKQMEGHANETDQPKY